MNGSAARAHSTALTSAVSAAVLVDSPSPGIASGSGVKRKHAGKGKKPAGYSQGGGGEGSDDDEGGEEDEERQKKKRNRMALSCRECKRRKIKCDRAMPVCGPCDKRNDPSNCTWDILSNEASLPTTIARTADVEAVLARVAHIEAYLRTLPPSLAAFVSYSPDVGDHKHALPQGTAQLSRPDMAEEGFEDAAVDLEGAVFGSRTLPGVYRKQENDPIGPKPYSDARTEPVASGSGLGRRITTGSGVESSARDLRFGGRPIELTKALTSIVRSDQVNSRVFTSRVGLSVEFGASPEQIDQARVEAVRKVFRALPPRDVIDHLVELYFARVCWLFHHLHAPSFRAELDAFHEMVLAGRETEIDVLWLALLLMVICVALDSTHSSRSPLSLSDPSTPAPSSSPLSSFDAEHLQVLPEVWFQAAQSALALGEWEVAPRIRSIQVIIFFTQYLQLCSSTRGQPSQLVTWLAGAISIAKILGLHRLGSNPEMMPQEDPAFPPGKNSVKREQAKRLWGVLVYQDWTGASSKNRSYQINPSHFDTDDPFNVNDADLSPNDWKVEPLPLDVLTDATADRVRIAMSRQFRKVFDAVVMTKDFTYETVLELDRGYHAILDNLPHRWTLGVTAEETEQPMLRYQRHFALESLHNRIFRLHRPFSTRGYTQPKYRFSTDACIKSARVVVVSTHNIADACKDIWYTYSHVLNAALILFNDLFQAIDSDLPAAEYESKKHTLLLASQIFSPSSSDSITSPSLRTVVQQGSKILQGLFRAEESRRISRAAQALVGGSVEDGVGERESFAEVLTRIGRSLHAGEVTHSGTPPPTRNLPLPSARTRLSPGQSGRLRALPASGMVDGGAAAYVPDMPAPLPAHAVPVPSWLQAPPPAPPDPYDPFAALPTPNGGTLLYSDQFFPDLPTPSGAYWSNGPDSTLATGEYAGAMGGGGAGRGMGYGGEGAWYDYDDATGAGQDHMANLLGQLSGTTGW